MRENNIRKKLTRFQDTLVVINPDTPLSNYEQADSLSGSFFNSLDADEDPGVLMLSPSASSSSSAAAAGGAAGGATHHHPLLKEDELACERRKHFCRTGPGPEGPDFDKSPKFLLSALNGNSTTTAVSQKVRYAETYAAFVEFVPVGGAMQILEEYPWYHEDGLLMEDKFNVKAGPTRLKDKTERNKGSATRLWFVAFIQHVFVSVAKVK
jgi:hypothetical protein